LQNQRKWEEQNKNNKQFTSRLDSIMATLQTILNDKETEKEGRNNPFSNVRNDPISDGILLYPKVHTRMEEVISD